MHYPEHLRFLVKTHLRTPFLQNSSRWLLSQMPVIFLERQNQKQFFPPPLRLIRLKSSNCIKIKILFIHHSEKVIPICLANFLIYMKYEKPIYVFYFMFTFSFKFLKTSFILNELVKHENKFNRKVFHDRENSENQFSDFSYFMKGFKK